MLRSTLAASSALALVMAAGGALAAGQPDESWSPPVDAQLGQSVTGELVEGDARTDEDGLLDRYSLTLDAGTRVEIVMRSEDFDTYLIVGRQTADGFEQIGLDDDGLGEGLNSRLRFIAADAGDYEIRARGFAGMGEGAYELSFSETEPWGVGAPRGSLTVGSEVRGSLSTDDPSFEWSENYRYDAYRFHADAGERIEAVARSDAFDTVLMIERESRWGMVEQVGSDDDGLGDGTNSRARFVASESGDYVVTITSYGEGGAGDYQLSLQQIAPLPEPETLAVGATVSGALENGDGDADDGRLFDAWAFDAVEGQRFEILADSPTFSTQIELGQETGSSGWEPYAYGDNYMAERTNSRLIFTAEETGRYVLRMYGSEPAMRGDYTLTLNDRGPLPPPPPPGSLRVGDTISGALAEGDGVGEDEKFFDDYDFSVSPDRRIIFTLRSETYDTYLYLYRRQDDGEYAEVARDDDSGGDLDSQIFLEGEAGDYRVRVSSFAMGEIGDYVLTVRDLGPPARPVRLRFGRDVNGRLDERDAWTQTEARYDSYSFRLREDERAQFIARSDDFDTYLVVSRETEDGREYIHYDDDGLGDGTTNSRLIFVAPEDGEYELWVMPFDATSLGAYTLESEELGPTPESVPIAFDRPVTGSLERGDGLTYEGGLYDGFTFDGTAGQRIRIDMQSEAFDTFLLLGIHGPDGLTAIAENDDSGGDGTNSILNFTLPSDAQYEFWATTYAAGEEGDYSVTLTDLGPPPEPGSLIIGSSVRGALGGEDPVGAAGTFYDAYRFEGELDHTVRITATSNAFDTYLELGRWEDGVFTPIAEDDDGLSDLNSLLTVTFPATGTYEVRVRSYSPGETGDYVLTVEEVPPI